MLHNIRFVVLNHMWYDRDALLVIRDTPNGPELGRIEWEPRPEGFMFEQHDGTIKGPRGTLAKLAAALESEGVTTGTSAELRAIKGWLEDMRALAFKQPKPVR